MSANNVMYVHYDSSHGSHVPNVRDILPKWGRKGRWEVPLKFFFFQHEYLPTRRPRRRVGQLPESNLKIPRARVHSRVIVHAV